jgi:hypothetical protein
MRSPRSLSCFLSGLTSMAAYVLLLSGSVRMLSGLGWRGQDVIDE